MIRGIVVAREFVRLAEQDEETLDQMRIYKLMYYAQGWSLAWYLEPLFTDRFEAWRHGLVPIETRRELSTYTEYSTQQLGLPSSLSEQAKRVIESVWIAYRQHSGYQLSQMTHSEPPWKDAYKPDGSGRCHEVITPDSMLAHFGKIHRQVTGEEPGSEAIHTAKIAADLATGRFIKANDFIKELRS